MMLLLKSGFARSDDFVGMSRSFLAATLAFSLISAVSAWPASAELIYGITNQGATALVTFDSANPSALLSSRLLTGLQSNETILGIDYRPSIPNMYGLGSTGRLYLINTTSGVVTAVPNLITPALNGIDFGFDFRSGQDQIYIVSEANQKIGLTVNGGGSAGPDLAYGPGDPNFGVDPNVVDIAFTFPPSNFPETYFGLDVGLDGLVTGHVASSQLTTIGPLGVNVVAAGGFDISRRTGIGYAALLPEGSSQSVLYSINLATGAATSLGVIDGSLIISGLAVQWTPEPTSALLLFLGAAFGFGTRWRFN
jgi:hypothetical protein